MIPRLWVACHISFGWQRCRIQSWLMHCVLSSRYCFILQSYTVFVAFWRVDVEQNITVSAQFLQFALQYLVSTVNSVPRFQGVYLLLYSVDCQRELPQGPCLRPRTKCSMYTTPRGWGPCHKSSAKYGECSHHFHKWKHSRHHWIHYDSWSAPQGRTLFLEHHTLFHPMKPILLDLQAITTTTTTLFVLTTCLLYNKWREKKDPRKVY